MNTEYEIMVKKYPVHSIIECVVEAIVPFGVFTNIGEVEYKGLIPIIEIIDDKKVPIDKFPEIGEKLKAIVLGITKDERKQVYLSIKPSNFLPQSLGFAE